MTSQLDLLTAANEEKHRLGIPSCSDLLYTKGVIWVQVSSKSFTEAIPLSLVKWAYKNPFENVFG